MQTQEEKATKGGVFLARTKIGQYFEFSEFTSLDVGRLHDRIRRGHSIQKLSGRY